MALSPSHHSSPAPLITHVSCSTPASGELWGSAIHKLSEFVSDATSMPSISDATKLYTLVGKDNKAGIAHANVLQQLVKLAQQEGQVRIVQRIVEGCRSLEQQQQQQDQQQESAAVPAAGGSASALPADAEQVLGDTQNVAARPQGQQPSSVQPGLCARLSEASQVLSGMLQDLPTEAASICKLLKSYEEATPGYTDVAFCCYMATAAEVPLIYESTSSAQVTAVVQLLKAADLAGALQDELFELPAR
jgi:hypothetical protein